MSKVFRITDIWFRSALPLESLADAIGLIEQTSDAEDFWAWVVGYYDGIAVDVARQQSQPPETVDTRILRLDLEPFSIEQKTEIITRLRTVVPSPITCGRWIHVDDNQYDLQIDEIV
jgi:hypothetical protein